jgi:hypothetical protein
MANLKVHIPMQAFKIMKNIGETSFWRTFKQLQHTLLLFKLDRHQIMAISYLPLLSALQILLLLSYGVSKASIKPSILTKVSPLYLRALNNISMHMASKMIEILSECSSQVTGLRIGFFTTLKPIQVIQHVFLEALLMVKMSLLLNFKVGISPQSTRELL